MKKTSFSAGFTLLEMLVCITIITIIFTILLGSNKRYAELLNLKNQTYNVVLYLRQAQIYSLGVKSTGSPASFGAAYGVHFDSTEPNNQFRFFTDLNNNGTFDTNPTTEPSEIITLLNGVTIASVSGLNNAGNPVYYGSGLFRNMSITFKRPKPDALMKFLNNGGQPGPGNIFPPAVINLTSPSGFTSSVKVEASGGISIQ